MTKRKNSYNPETGEITLTQPVVSRPFTSGPCVGISQTLVVGTKLKIDINQLLGSSSTMSLLAIDGIDKSGTLNQEIKADDRSKMPQLSEWHIYGNEQQGRFSVRKPDAEPLYYLDVLTNDVSNKNFFRILDKKQYELKDHLGNVRVAIGDMKIPTGTRGIAPFVVDEKSVRDYYPGGMPIQDRTWQLNNYRYGYNKGSEIDKEIYAGEGRAFSTLFREGDTYSLRWWSTDPKASEQPYQSSYNYMDGNPIWHNDPLGDIDPKKTVENYSSVSSFKMRLHPILNKNIPHRAIDLTTKEGTKIFAYASGTVIKVAVSPTWGNYIVIQHEEGYFSLYAHIKPNSIKVKEMQNVVDGQNIAEVGTTGRSTGPHLHLEVGQSKNVNEFLSTKKREQTRANPEEIGDLQEKINSSKNKTKQNSTKSKSSNTKKFKFPKLTPKK